MAVINSTTSTGLRPRSTSQLASQLGYSQADEDAYAFITNTLKAWGLESLSADVQRFLEQGYSNDRVMIELQETQAYKTRFKGNEIRRQAGLPVLSPAEYLAVESTYKQIMSTAGLPIGFYDSHEDFDDWIGKDVSPQEVQSRVESATKLIESTDPLVRTEFEKYYTRGDMIAYALDRTRTATILERQVRAAQIGAAGAGAGVGVDRTLAEQIADQGIDEAAARQGFGTAAQLSEAGSRLASVYGGEYGDEEAARDVFLTDASASATRRRLASQERAAFSGTSGLNETSLSKRRAGSL